MAEFEGYTGVWRRLKSGAAIFIRDGEDIKKAVRRNFNGDKATQKLREYDKKDYEAFEREQQARRDLGKVLKEKGELSADYEKVLKTMKQAKAEQNKIYNEKHDYINEMQDLARKQEQGLKIKQEQANRLKEVGNTKKSLADLRKAVREYNEKKGKDGSISLKSEIELGEQKNRFADKYGYETMKEEMEKINKTTDKYQTPKERAAAINEINKNVSKVGYKYYTKHGMGPGAVPTDVKISNIKDYDDGMTSFETNRPLSSKELNYYSIENEIKNAEYDAKYGARKQAADYLDNVKDNGASLKSGVNDKDIENDIRSLFIYKNEKGMGSLDAEPLKKYYDKHGKENVDRVWKQMEDKYEVIEGTSMDNEGLRYNNLIEKSKYSPEAIQNYKNKMNTIYEKFGTNSRKYNEAAEAAADEFEKAPKTSTAKQMNYDAEVEKYYRTISVDNISADLEERKYRMEKDLYAPNDKEKYQKWNEATERYLINRMEGKKADTNRFKAEVSRTPKQRAAAIDKANDSYYEKTKKDLLSHYTKDYGYDGNPEEAFVKQMDAVNYGNATPYQMGKRLAEGGNYLIYNGDMKAYLSRRGIKATEDNAFDKYTDYIAKQSAKLYEEIKKNKK